MPRKKPNLSPVALMAHTGVDVGSLVESNAGKEELIPSVKALWERLPLYIQVELSAKLTPRAKAYLAIKDAQAKYWRNAYERLTAILEEMNIYKTIQDQEQQKERAEESVCISKEKNSDGPPYRKGNGRGPIDSNYPWLADRHDVPGLRRALGLSDEGMRKMCRALNIVPTKLAARKGNVTSISRASALRLLLQRLSARRRLAVKEAEAIWRDYGSKQARSSASITLLCILSGAYVKSERVEPKADREPFKDWEPGGKYASG
jgi:hypothetical protein